MKESVQSPITQQEKDLSPNSQSLFPSDSSSTSALDLSAIGQRLDVARGQEYWRSLDELAGTEEFHEFLHREFPRQASEWADPVGRRRFLQLMGASLALAGLSACTRQPAETILPYVKPPEETIPGKPLYFATAMPLGGIGIGVLVESHEGRPTKVEGNPDHPASLGATDLFAQASVLTLYDPDRSQTLTYLGDVRTWSAFLSEISSRVEGLRSRQGAGLRLLTETVTSPTLAAQIKQLLIQFPLAKWHQYEPLCRDNALAGARLAFGEYVNTIYRIENADVILSLDADFLTRGPGSVRYARQFASRRRLRAGQNEMNRLYVLESMPTGTGAVADHRLPLRAGAVKAFAGAIASRLGVQVGGVAESDPVHEKWVSALVNDLQQHRGRSLIIAGEDQPPIVHALAAAMNQVLGNVGQTVVYTEPVEASPVEQLESLRELVADLNAGRVELLLILGGNPVYTAPADLNFKEALYKAPLRIHLSLYNDETSEHCQWHVPETHYLEAWSDVRAYDGTVTIMQPLIAPLYQGKSAHELLAVFLGQADRSNYDLVRDYWKSQQTVGDFEQFWRKALHDGVVPNTALATKNVSVQVSALQVGAPDAPLQGLELNFRPDPTIYDGRFANNGWLQELPKPLTKLTWDNAAMISPATAARLGISYKPNSWGGGGVQTDVVNLKYKDRSLSFPAWIVPGHPDDCVTVHLGYGRTRVGRVSEGAGANAYALRTSDAPWIGSGLSVEKTGEQYTLACTQLHHNIDTEDLKARQAEIIRSGTLAEYQKDPALAPKEAHHSAEALSLYPEYEYDGYAWGMAIDLTNCIGCNACVVACQAENNIPVVGKEQVLFGREMHWLRIDQYFKGGQTNPQVYFQPMLCQHCERAPCEVVCPVNATVHDAEGLNNMVYNRCVGTRYCSNNCPYKVRRFNFLLFQDWKTPSLKLQRNPDVTVRSRGVMEKCSFCTQRIQAAKIEAAKENRKVRDGEILTACQAVCPTEAIVFGDINDPNSRVAKMKQEKRNYSVLESLNTKPRTSYLAALRNPNPEIEE